MRSAWIRCVTIVIAACQSHQDELAGVQQELNALPQISDFVVYAEHGVTLGTYDHILGGDLGVALRTPTGAPSQLILSGHDIDVQGNLLAPSVYLGPNTNVGDVQTFDFQNGGGHYRNLYTFPYTLMPRLPLAPLGVLGTIDVTVVSSQTLTLQPGQYGALAIEGTALLAPGVYTFTSVHLGGCGRLYAKRGGVEVQVAASFTTDGPGTPACPAKISAVNEGQCDLHGNCVATAAPGLILNISGDDTTTSNAVVFGQATTVNALVSAPHGTVSLGDYVSLKGAVTAYDVAAGQHVSLELDGGFASTEHTGTQQLSGYFEAEPDSSFAIVRPVASNTMVKLSIGLPVQNGDAMKTQISAILRS